VREWSGESRKRESHTTDSHLPDLDRPIGVPAAYADHAKLMFDLRPWRLQGDVTRVITFQLARETSTRTYPEIAYRDPHHSPFTIMPTIRKDAGWRRSTSITFRCIGYFLDRLKAPRMAKARWLDHALLLYGSGMGNPDVHDHINLPILVAGARPAG